MKKIIYTAAFILTSSTLFFACKKDHTCKCTFTLDTGSGTVSEDSSFTITKATKKNAKSTCDNTGSNLNKEAQQYDGTASCELN
jgi:hypothetical protein